METPSRRRKASLFLIALALGALAGMAFVNPIRQDPAYHNFADKRPWHGIPNFGDVASNVLFSVVGAAGLAWLGTRSRVGPDQPFLTAAERRVWGLIFLGVFLTGFGSAYYHASPTTERLFWDRLPMTVVFMSLMAVSVMERISLRAGSLLLAPLVLLGVFSALWWTWGESHGAGDLRLYALVQFYPVVAIPFMFALFPPRYTRTMDFALVFAWYVLAKVNEHFDVRIFVLLGHSISGHTLKHLAAGMGMAQMLRMVMLRRPVQASQESAGSARSL